MRQRDHKPLGTLENDPGIRRKSAGEMNAEVSCVLLKGAVNLVSILAVGKYPSLAQGSRSIQLAIFEQKPLIRVFGFYFLSAE
jgi:hypothetical protein